MKCQMIELAHCEVH